jgi:hypothetical protein
MGGQDDRSRSMIPPSQFPHGLVQGPGRLDSGVARNLIQAVNIEIRRICIYVDEDIYFVLFKRSIS